MIRAGPPPTVCCTNRPWQAENAALWAPAADRFPPRPAFATLLSDPAPAWIRTLRNTAAQIHYDFYR